MVSPAWAGVLNTAADARLPNQQQQLQLLDKQKLFLGSSPSTSSYIGGKQLSFLQGGSTTLNNQLSLEAPPVCQPLLRTIALSESGGARSKMYCDRLTARVHDSDCALSLLSSTQSQTSGLDLSHVMHPNPASLVQPLGPSLHGDSLEPMDSVLVSNSNGNNVHCQGMFLMGSDGSQATNETPQTLPFHWGVN